MEGNLYNGGAIYTTVGIIIFWQDTHKKTMNIKRKADNWTLLLFERHVKKNEKVSHDLRENIC